jgi:hypothetical protein
MNAAARLSLATLALFMLVACGGTSAPDADPAGAAEDDAAAADLGRDTDDTVFDDMIETQDKARAVEGVSLGHKQGLDEAIEAAAGDSADAGDE